MSLLEKDVYGNQCEWCQDGVTPPDPGSRPAELCGICNGTGRKLTEVGTELTDFLRDHYGLVPTQVQGKVRF